MNGVAGRLKRLEVLARMIERGTAALPWFGRVALQKLVYILQYIFGADLGYSYGFHHFGPYVPELTDDLAIGESAGRWRSRDESFLTAEGTVATGKHFKVSAQSPFPKSVMEAAEQDWAKLGPRVGQACEAIKGRTARDLELVASLHYLRHVQGVSPPELPGILMALKPKFTPDDVREGLVFLDELESRARDLGPVAK